MIVVLVSAALVSAGIVTLGAPLVPQIQLRFGLTELASQWSYTITLLVGATAAPVLGRLADGPRRRPAMGAVCLAVAAGCGLSATAGSYSVFLVGRAAQGLGVALVAMAIATARDHLSGRRATKVVALLSLTTALGAGSSYPLTTIVVQHQGLPAAFGGAAVLAAVVAVTVMVGVPISLEGGRRPGLDVTGSVLLMTATALGLVVISQGNRWGWVARETLVVGAASIVLAVSWVFWEIRAAHPLVELRLFRERNVLAANVVALLMGVSLFTTPVLLSRIAQAPAATGYGSGLSLTAVGLIMIPVAVGNIAGGALAVYAGEWLGPRMTLAGGGAVAGLGPMVLMAADGGVWRLLAGISLSACGAGITFSTMTQLIVVSVAPGQTGSATSFNIVLRTVGGAVGSAATAAIIAAGPGPVPGYPSATAFAAAFSVCAGTCVLSMLVSAVLPLRVGPRLRSRTSPIPTD
ncbi:MAG: hypothetical protein ABS81_01075 [Pseudonocardia sp. SCN 72-86]|nr:MAG: hypothetical protein ABS81_01075 [Pseudonocardia sp. SCN 72-86]